jgi:YVTN family beta-propeller protein
MKEPTGSIVGRIERTCLLLVLLASISTTFMLQSHVEALRPPGCKGGVDVGNRPEAVTVAGPLATGLDGTRIFVANKNSDTVSVIGPDDRTVATVTVGIGPADIKYDGLTNQVYVANSGSNNISVIDPTTNRVVDTLPVGSRPIGLDLASPFLYVANYYSNTVTKHDTYYGNTTNYSGVSRPTALGVGLSGLIYVLNLNGIFAGYLHKGKFVPLHNWPGISVTDIVVEAERGYPFPGSVYVTGGSTIHKIEAIESPNATFPLAPEDYVFHKTSYGPVPGASFMLYGIAVGTNHMIYVSDFIANRVFVIDGTRIGLTDNKTLSPVVASVLVGRGPLGLTVDRDRKLVYVANSACNTISVINGTTNKLNSAVTFTTDPPTSGTISCNSDPSHPWHVFKDQRLYEV